MADQSLPRQIRYWPRFDLVIIDEFGFDRIERGEYAGVCQTRNLCCHRGREKGKSPFPHFVTSFQRFLLWQRD